MCAVIDTTSASIEVTVDGTPVLRLCLVAYDHADARERTNVATVLNTEDVIGLLALLRAHLQTQGVQS